MNKHQTQKARIRNLTQLAMLSAIIIILAFTPLGYLSYGGIEITFIAIPVVIGAILMGPCAGAILGGVFGFTSCLHPSAALFFSINPLFTIMLLFIPRILIGVFSGLIAKAFSKNSKRFVFGAPIAALTGAVTNTVFYMTLLCLLFGSSDIVQGWMNSLNTTNFFIFAITFVSFNAVIEALVTTVVGGAISLALIKALKIKQ